MEAAVSNPAQWTPPVPVEVVYNSFCSVEESRHLRAYSKDACFIQNEKALHI
jgi:hypothetical protein